MCSLLTPNHILNQLWGGFNVHCGHVSDNCNTASVNYLSTCMYIYVRVWQNFFKLQGWGAVRAGGMAVVWTIEATRDLLSCWGSKRTQRDLLSVTRNRVVYEGMQILCLRKSFLPYFVQCLKILLRVCRKRVMTSHGSSAEPRSRIWHRAIGGYVYLHRNTCKGNTIPNNDHLATFV